jgi:hypothetical protein
MTDLEKINRPVVYSTIDGYSTVKYQGKVKTQYGESVKYLFAIDYVTKKFASIRCFSFFDKHQNPIASFNVKKLHDTR